MEENGIRINKFLSEAGAVSYTHLDVYKRQVQGNNHGKYPVRPAGCNG